jgi:hypothetical protein
MRARGRAARSLCATSTIVSHISTNPLDTQYICKQYGGLPQFTPPVFHPLIAHPLKEVNQTRSNQVAENDSHEIESSGPALKAPAFALTATPPPADTGTTGDCSNMAKNPVAPPVAPAAPAAPVAPAPAAPVLSVRTALDAADGSGRNRRRVGVGEQVVFTSTVSGTWAASAGDPAAGAAGTTFAWKAPNRAASADITVTTASGNATLAMTVVEPNANNVSKIADIPYGAGLAGAGMRLNFDFAPMNVSFANVEFREVSGPATNITGYFTARSAAANFHNANANYIPINGSNRMMGTDTAAVNPAGYAKPWSAGGRDWVIPNRFRVIGEAGEGPDFTNVTQRFEIQADGTVTVSKGAASVTRTP